MVLCQNSKVYFDNFTLQNGLSDNYINCILQDNKGWLWLGTGMGINRFDGIKFKKYEVILNKGVAKENLPIRVLYECKNGDIFVGLEDFGLARYNRNNDQFERFYLNKRAILTEVSVKDMAEDNTGNLWVGTKNGLYKIDFKKQMIDSFQHNAQNSLADNYVRKLVFDDNNNLWIGTQKGLDKFNPESISFTHYATYSSLLNDDILEITKDRNRRLWIGTSTNSVVILNTSTNSVVQYIPDRKNERSFKVNSIIKDNNHNFWIGTRGGLYCFNEQSNSTRLFENNVVENNSLIHNSILDILQDAKGDLWIGTRGGLSYMVKEKQAFETFRAQPNNNKYLNNSEVFAIWMDNSEQIWLGTENGGVNIFDRKKETFRYLTQSNSGLSNNCIKAIQACNGNVLIGTFKGGLNVYNQRTGGITVYKHNERDKNSISNDIVWSICIDKTQNIWIATGSGLDRFNLATETFEHFPEFDDMVNGVSWIGVDADNDLWLGAQFTKVFRPGRGVIKTFREKGRGFFVDSKGRNWIMTGDRGIVQYDKLKGAQMVYDENAGIACNLTYCMLEDAKGLLWVSTAKGLSCFDANTKTFKNYYSINGLQGDQFHYGAAFKSRQGQLLFGGVNGFNIFNPDENIQNNYIPPVYITDFKIFNQSVKIGDNYSILERAISETQRLRIPYKFNVLTFEFAALNYTNSAKNRYKYKLEGFDQKWTETSENRNVTYTNLNPGKYTFFVIACNDKGLWNKTGASIELIILPPFYRTFWFAALMLVILVISVLAFLYFAIKRLELKKALEFEKMQAQKMHELDSFKLQLFTNISHEIKTPLTLITSPLKKILKHQIADPEMKENLQLMDKNADQLLHLVTQLLDYRKLQDGKLIIEPKQGDIVKFCKDVFFSFKNVLKDNKIQYTFQSAQDEINTGFDPDKLRNILNNLIFNAIRYNKQGGTISFFISAETGNNQDVKQYVKIVISDTGIGISRNDIANIFDRYYSKYINKENTSSGIGLSFTRELVELHNGKISVESEEGKGTTFTVMLPFIDSEPDLPESKVDEWESFELSGEKTSETVHKQKIMLIIEDNEDMLCFIHSHFNNAFTVMKARDGEEGWRLALKAIPDIIVSDVMMPKLNGIEFCERIKNDERTSHIPIILLTALSSKENIKTGLVAGADDYITKPFDIDLLETKVVNLLTMRKSLIEKFSKQKVLHPSNVGIKTSDEKFLEKVIRITEKHIDNPELNIDTFVDSLGVSRMQLYRKLDALTNMTVKEFVNDIRMKRAEQILSEKKVNISEVAYAVGFNDLSYFGKCFKRKYGISASEYNLKATAK
jgi:ligand-binding sensor domain-containing protein/signal transduction histidine kinase/DNA-binding response OmpR family regulator